MSSSVNKKQCPTSRVQRLESKDQIQASKLQRLESKNQIQTSRVQSPAPRVERPDSSIQTPAPRVQGSDSSVQSPESSVQHLRPETANSIIPTISHISLRRSLLFNWKSLYASYYKAWSYKKKKPKNVKAYGKSV